MFPGSKSFRPDIILASGEEGLILELKMSSPTKPAMERAQNQLLSFMRSSPTTKNGIVFFFPSQKGVNMLVKNADLEPVEEMSRNIAIIYPGKDS